MDSRPEGRPSFGARAALLRPVARATPYILSRMSHNTLPILALCSILVAMTHAANPSSNSAVGTKFAELSDQFVKESLALSPTNAFAAGYHKHVDPRSGETIEMAALLDDLSLKGI